MRFDASKCEIMHIRKAQSFTNYTPYLYQLGGHVLNTVNEAKYLGVFVSCELDWSPQINHVVKKANRSLGFIKRNLRQCPKLLKERAYLAQVRSVLEYSASVWDPYLDKDIDPIERVQRKAARFVCRDYGRYSSVTTMLNQLGWRDLELRRRNIRLALLYKIINGHVAVTAADLKIRQGDTRTRGHHPHKLETGIGKTDLTKNSFTVRTILDWNSLPTSVVEANTTDTFSARLARTTPLRKPLKPTR